MTSYLSTQFTIQHKLNFDFLEQPTDSDSENETHHHRHSLNLQDQSKDHKKQKKVIDIELVKEELSKRPILEVQIEKKNQLRRLSKKKSARTINDLILPTSPILVDQLCQLKKIKEIRSEIPPELLGRIFSELRYEHFPALTTIYRQGDLNKNFYIILEGKVVVMKPKQRMVGSSKIEIEDLQIDTDNDPYGLKALFPEYIILKMLHQGDSFGEAAIKLDTTRSSTVVALESTHVIYLNENAFLEYINPYLSSALDSKMKYFSKTPLFQSIETQDYMGIVLESKLVTYKSGDTIYEEGDKTKYIYFIINGEIELMKKVGRKSVILSSYGEFQCVGEVEIMMKIHRFTNAKVITPRLTTYRIRKRAFFDNLASYGTYEQMKRHSSIIYKHWQLISNSVLNSINPVDEVFINVKQVYAAAEDELQNKRNMLSKSILNKKIIETQGSKLSQIKVFQNITEQHLKDLKKQDPYNQNVLQRVYSNTLQKYQTKLLKKPQIQLQCSEDTCIRGIVKQKTNTSINDNNSTTSPLNENSIDQILQSKRSSTIVKGESSSKLSLPSIHSSVYANGPQPQSLDTVLESISQLPKVPRDNLVLSLMYQQAYKADNPKKKAKEIQQVIQASYRNVQNQFLPKRHHQTELHSMSTDIRMKKNVQLNSLQDIHSARKDYVNFVQQKKICSMHIKI